MRISAIFLAFAVFLVMGAPLQVQANEPDPTEGAIISPKAEKAPGKAKGEAAKSAKGEKATKKDGAAGKYTVVFTTSKGDIEVEVDPKWSPKGAARLRELVSEGFFKEIAFFRAVEGFVVQFGIHGDPKVSEKWRNKTIADDPVVESNKEGWLTFATSGPNSRTTQMFFNLRDNNRLDSMGFSPVGKITKGLDVLKSLYMGYGEGAPMGSGPAQDLIQMKGNSYLKASFPKLDYIRSAKIR